MANPTLEALARLPGSAVVYVPQLGAEFSLTDIAEARSTEAVPGEAAMPDDAWERDLHSLERVATDNLADDGTDPSGGEARVLAGPGSGQRKVPNPLHGAEVSVLRRLTLIERRQHRVEELLLYIRDAVEDRR